MIRSLPLPLPSALLNLREGAVTVAPAAVDTFFRLVKAAAPLAERLPAFPGSALMAAALNVVFGASADGLELILGKRIAIRVTDAGLRFHFKVTRAGFMAVRERGWADVTISATARDFIDIAARRADPDTLFFARRLVVEGETESGLAFKNRLDALDPEALTRPPRLGLVLKAVATALGAPVRERNSGPRDGS